MAKKYELPPLPYNYNALEPIIIEEIMRLHHQKHHQAYVNGANAALERLEKNRRGENPENIRGILRDLSFNLSGHRLHTVFWNNMAPPGRGGGKPGGRIADQIEKDFGGFELFMKQFSDAAKNVEAVGWAILTYDPEIDSLIIYQVEKQNFMHPPSLPLLLTLDVWEHAYYLQYKNDRSSYVDNWWKVVNWDDVEKRFSKAKS
ncbi:MAG: superoxide dismutase [Thaumarchaeota archaeon]|jgi:Fe-Mn family superoxide dismutase|nr:superoxide dismutase [Candidatus Geocrenenecus arthurdayi]MCL7389641.1 superoxide dismutase [Candidatus Geocrenenecus arthurdayi]MCL7391088.1 superoxide dismutase [Candidatus Geocrenenecus arthurdayi]MCL7396924.1 superoxide dismutase [Candidatus Geocrenenecus arthurdayi]MCL7402201.1 superoxide dismutase [Candidatus Geocrenenecus arthurdayi]